LLADYRYWAFQMKSFGSNYRTIFISLRHFYIAVHTASFMGAAKSTFLISDPTILKKFV